MSSLLKAVIFIVGVSVLLTMGTLIAMGWYIRPPGVVALAFLSGLSGMFLGGVVGVVCFLREVIHG